MPWLSEYELKQEVNFFEGRVRDYRTGQRSRLGLSFFFILQKI